MLILLLLLEYEIIRFYNILSQCLEHIGVYIIGVYIFWCFTSPSAILPDSNPHHQNSRLVKQ